MVLQSGLGNEWWADSIECYCHLRNIQDHLSDGKTLKKRRFGVPCNGPVIPFGAIVEYHPISAEDLSRLHQFGPQVLPVIFLGYALHVGGIWKGDILVADIEELEQMDASELHARRLNAKEVLTPMRGDNFMFPFADGTVKPTGGDQVRRTFTLIQDRPDRGEEQGNLRGDSDGSSSTQLRDSSWYDGDARNDFWSISGIFIYRHHVEPRVKLYVPREESFPVPLKEIDVSRTTDTSLDVMLEKNIDHYWNVDGDRELSDTWTDFTRFTILNVKPPDGYTWSGERLTRKQATSRPDTLWPEIWKDVSVASKRKEKQKCAIEKPKLDNGRRLRGMYFIYPEDGVFKDIMKNARRKLEIPMPASMPCKIRREKYRETCRVEKECNTKIRLHC